jgi:type I restriction enzyme M protein
MNKCNLHTILRLPTGIFYAAGVKTNVLFFTKGSATDKLQDENCTQNVWVYDLRTNMPNFGKRTPFGEQHLTPFESVYGEKADGTSSRTEGEYSFGAEQISVNKTKIAENQGVDEKLVHSRWRCFARDWVASTKSDSLDISWLKDKDSVDAADLPEPSVLATEAKAELSLALSELDGLLDALGEAN